MAKTFDTSDRPKQEKSKIPDWEYIKAYNFLKDKTFTEDDLPALLVEYAKRENQAYIKDAQQVKGLAKEIMLSLLSNPESYHHPHKHKDLISKAHDIAKAFLRHNH